MLHLCSFYIVNNYHCYKIFIKLNYISLIYFKTKQDILNLRYSFVATHFRSNQTNFQRSWLLNKGTEPLKWPQTQCSNLTVEHQTPAIIQHDLPKLDIYKWHPTDVDLYTVSVIHPCFLYIFTKIRKFLYFIFDWKKLNSESKLCSHA